MMIPPPARRYRRVENGKEQAHTGARRAVRAPRGIRFPRIWAPLPPARPHHLAAGSRRVVNRDFQNRRPREHEDDRRVHDCSVEAAGGTHAPDSGKARKGREAEEELEAGEAGRGSVAPRWGSALVASRARCFQFEVLRVIHSEPYLAFVEGVDGDSQYNTNRRPTCHTGSLVANIGDFRNSV